MKITIAGTGYVGLVTAACMAEKGHEVICVDIDAAKIDRLSAGEKDVIYEDGLDALIEKNRQRLYFTTDYQIAYQSAEVIFIGVGTPEKKDGSANLRYVYNVVRQIADSVGKNTVVVIKSTVPIGTNDKIEKMFSDLLAQRKKAFHIDVVSNPEFLAQGSAVRDTLYATRIVIGTESAYAREIMRNVYQKFSSPKLFTNRRSAEMIKYASNNFLALKISYINEIANLCEEVGADIEEVAAGMGYDPRIGPHFLKAGIGYGGSCFPKDTKALHWVSSFYDHEIKTINAAIEVNENQKLKLLKKAKKYYESFEGLTVAVLGLTFKPGTDDLREAPSLANVPILLDDGAFVRVYDPVGIERFRKLYPDEVIYCASIEEALTDADVCFIFTEWEEIKKFDPQNFVRLMRNPVVLDGRNCLSREAMHEGGVFYESIGRK